MKGAENVAGVTGLEPAASGVTGRRSNQLSYTPLIKPELSTDGYNSCQANEVKELTSLYLYFIY